MAKQQEQEKDIGDKVVDSVKNLVWGPQTKALTKMALLGIALGTAGALNNKLRG